MLLSEAIEVTYKNRWKHKETGLRAYNQAYEILKLLGDIPVRQIKYQSFIKVIDTLVEGGLKPSSINRKLSAISAVLTEARRLGVLPYRVDIPRLQEHEPEMKFLSREQEKVILEYFFNQKDTEMYNLTTLLVDTGLRLGEALSLTDQNIKVNGTVSITLNKTKTKKVRTVPCTERVQEIVLSREGKIINLKVSQVQYRWRLMQNTTGIKINIHALRHTTATRLLEAGVDIAVVKEWLGHTNIQTTMRYTHVTDYHLRDALNKLNHI